MSLALSYIQIIVHVISFRQFYFQVFIGTLLVLGLYSVFDRASMDVLSTLCVSLSVIRIYC